MSYGSRSYLRFSIIPEVFWGTVNFIIMFFTSMFRPGMNSRGETYQSDYRLNGGPGGGGGGGGPRRRMGGMGFGSGGAGPPPMAGGG